MKFMMLKHLMSPSTVIICISRNKFTSGQNTGLLELLETVNILNHLRDQDPAGIRKLRNWGEIL